jgi:arginyl-tRNA synthetase
MAREPETGLGPVEVRLGAALARMVGTDLPLTVTAPKNRTVGDVKVFSRDATSTQGCALLAARFGEHPDVESAVAIPPNLYVRPSLEFMRDATVASIRAQRTTYGCTGLGHGARVHVQFSCPNMNKALHLGHLRTNVMGMALAHVFDACGYDVIRTDQPSDWGRHIAKVVTAYRRWGNGSTPSDAAEKPDHFVGRFYSRFQADEAELTEELEAVAAGLEAGDPDLLTTNALLTDWAYGGIQETYVRIGTSFDTVLREGDTLRLANQIIDRHVGGHCQRRPDGSLYLDLSDVGLRPVTVRRQDGSALLHAYFLGASARRDRLDHGARLLFLMGREYAATVPELQEVVRRLGFPVMADGTEAVYHGMVVTGTRKMSSREDAVEVDDLLDAVGQRFRDDWLGVGERLDPFRRETCGQLAVALVKHHFLRTPRMKDVVWSEDELWERALPRFTPLVQTLAVLPTVTGRGSGREHDQRTLLLMLNDFTGVVQETMNRRDPSHLIRFADGLVEAVRVWRRGGGDDADTAEAAAIVLRRALALSNIALPPFLSDLPPSLAA